MQVPLNSIERSPIASDLPGLFPISLVLVSDPEREWLWDQLVAQCHYLGYRKLLGHRLKYLVFSGSRPLAALSWSAPARRYSLNVGSNINTSEYNEDEQSA
ncbi:MAG: DUF4338 domain-containing protein [Candidatus Omnitrophota bacterium]|nr:MAG: DUF4338 domain-containing protein [Candidatus Omnitrophota bacterium]